MRMKKNILTIATGKKMYVDLAVNLARSFWYWNKDSEIQLYIVTDHSNLLPVDVKAYAIVIPVQPGQLGTGFSPKLHLDKLAPEGQTIFIDSDCLIFGRLDELFEKFKGHSVSVIGDYISEGEWFGNIQAICKHFHVAHIPKFNGGIYYLENGTKAAAVYSTARKLEKTYDQSGFIRLRNNPNDEVLMAVAMQLHHEQPITEDGTIMSDPQACPGGYGIDVIKGKCWLLNPPASHRLHQTWYPFEKVFPLIVHFLGYYTNHYPYKREAYKLARIGKGKSSQLVINLVAFLTIVFPSRVKHLVKYMLRPLYRSLFGTRKVKPSNRI